MPDVSHGPPSIFDLVNVVPAAEETEDRDVPMYTITKQFSFSASHQLDHLPPDHQCARLHGHNYIVEVVIRCPLLDDRGFAQVDYGELDPFADYLKATLDHRHLDDVLPVRTTAENLAKFLFDRARDLSPYVHAVRVSETPRTWAEYSS
jgi:6-pyruvoyltetrahydropterin/6-carboxytetrahydropterin synthase